MKTATKTLSVLGLAGAMIAGMALGNPAPAAAKDGFIPGLIIGGVAGSLATRAHDDYHYGRRHHRTYYRSDGSRWRTRNHLAWCYDHYRSYDERSNTWVSYSGDVRQCRSPYWG